MRLAVLGFLAALVALPFAAEAAQPATRWAVTLSGRVVETYNYGNANRTAECTVRRFRQDDARVARREHTSHRRQRRALALTRAVPAGAALSRTHHEDRREGLVDGDASVPGRGDPHRFGHVQRELRSEGRVRPAFGWAGANRIAFRRRSVSVPLRMCGFDWTSSSPDSWLSVAPGRVDEEVLLDGSRRTVVARADVTRDTMSLPFEPPSGTMQHKLRVVWTLLFRRLS